MLYEHNRRSDTASARARRRRAIARARVRNEGVNVARPLVAIIEVWDVRDGELRHRRDPWRRLPLTSAGVRRAGVTVGALLNPSAVAGIVECLVWLSLAKAHVAAPRTGQDAREAAMARLEARAVREWSAQAHGERAGGAA